MLTCLLFARGVDCKSSSGFDSPPCIRIPLLHPYPCILTGHPGGAEKELLPPKKQKTPCKHAGANRKLDFMLIYICRLPAGGISQKKKM